MKRSSIPALSLLVPSLVLLAYAALPATPVAAQEDPARLHRLIAVPHEDRFLPFAITIHVGDTVEFVNTDADDHTVVSDDALNSAGPRNVDVVIPGTGEEEAKGKDPFRITFHDSGVWVYYCRFHSHLDEHDQPAAPGPDGGIQTEKDPTMCDPAGTDTCNFGTPMMGVISILPRRHHGDEDTVQIAPRN